MTYRGYTIEYQAPPIPSWCGVDYLFWNDDGEESVASSEEDAKVQIDLLLGEDCEHLDQEDVFCSNCAGCGEGMNEGTNCIRCNGMGVTGKMYCVDCGEHIN